MDKRTIYLSPPHLTDEALPFIREALASNWIAPVGPDVDAFERELAAIVGTENLIATNSGTSAIHLGLLSLGVVPGDEVLCSSLTFCASANPIVYCGATPVFVDSERTTWNIDPDLLAEAKDDRIRKSGRPPKAAVVVHLYGMPAQMSRILAVARQFGVRVLEDSAEALGSLYDGQQVGTLGDVGVLSFNGNKIITASSGGALFSSHRDLVEKARYLRQEAKEPLSWYEHKSIGYNYRLSNTLAALGRSQLRILSERVQRRREIFSFYERELSRVGRIEFQPEANNTQSNRWLTTVLLPIANDYPERVRLALAADDIESRPFWKPMHQQPVFKDAPYYGNGVSDELFGRGLCLPSGSDLREEDLKRIVRIVRKVCTSP